MFDWLKTTCAVAQLWPLFRELGLTEEQQIEVLNRALDTFRDVSEDDQPRGKDPILDAGSR